MKAPDRQVLVPYAVFLFLSDLIPLLKLIYKGVVFSSNCDICILITTTAFCGDIPKFNSYMRPP